MGELRQGPLSGVSLRVMKSCCVVAPILNAIARFACKPLPKTPRSTLVERGVFVMLPNKLATPSWNRFMLALK